ncbi:MAG: aerolysin family beta-barrel pore-forming toxin [Spiroplasmataceae bacterium]|nr:aerolysin family beta-barrel pore-forming toxin [Spiroplasmataceae bacterium]
MVSFKEYIEKKYSEFGERANVKKLNLTEGNFEGKINFAGLGFDNLEKIICWQEQVVNTNLEGLNADKLISIETKKSENTSKEPTVLLPRHIYIKIDNNKYLSRENSEWFSFSKQDPDQYCRFFVANLDKNKIALQADDGRWLSFKEPNGKPQVQVIEEFARQNCQFTIIHDSENQIYLKATDGLFLGADESVWWLMSGKNFADKNCKFFISGAQISREIKNVEYKVSQSVIKETKPLIVLEAEVKNDSSSETKQTLSYSYNKSEKGTWNNSSGMEIGTKTVFEAEIPFLKAGREIGFSENHLHEWGGTKSKEEKITSSTEVSVPAKSARKVKVFVNQSEINIPFSYSEYLKNLDGSEDYTRKTNGIYKNLETYKIDVQVEDIKINEKQETQELESWIQIPFK